MATIHDEEFDDLMVAAVTIDEHDITGEYCRLSADMAYFCRRLADAEANFLRAKAGVKHAQSEGFIYLLKAATADGKKKPSDPALEAGVECLEAVRRAHEEYAFATKARKEAQGVVDAICAKRDMLVQLGASRRQEMRAHID